MGTIKDTTKGNIFFFDANDQRLVVIMDKSHKLYDRRVELPLEENMLKSILDKGILSPVIVRRVGDEYHVTDGRRRTLHAREIQRRHPDLKVRIPVLIRTAKDFEALEIATISNVQRQDDSPVIRGENAARMLEMGGTREEIADLFGVEWSTVQCWITLFERGVEQLHKAVEANEVTLTKAIEIARKRPERQLVAIEKARCTVRPKRGPKKGTPRRRTIRIVARERDDNSGFDIEMKSKCTPLEISQIVRELAEYDDYTV